MYANVMLMRQWSRLTCFCQYSSFIEGQKIPQSGTSVDGISPPIRIPRGPTDILQALAATVGPDPTAAHYKYHDDPFLIPLSNYRKRAYALSAEAGRKAAAWIRDEHADLFTTRQWDPPLKKTTPYFNADPRIDLYSPKPIYNDESKVTEEDLKYTIENALVEDSIKVFQLLGGVNSISEDLKLRFLQLLCFYNEKEPDSMEWLEERWFAANTRERQATTWKLGGLADKIFTSMDPKTPEAYCAVIQGMAKYYQAERAHMLSQEAIEKGITLSTNVYNMLLSCVGFLKEGVSLRTEALLGLLKEMEQQGISPDAGTLTASLRSLSVWGGGKLLQQLALQIVAEFKQLGLEPGLSAYYYLLCQFCKEQGPRINILSGILNDLEKRETLIAMAPTDTNFFITAMGICSDHLQDINMAERVHALLMKGDNYMLLGDAYKESIYYRHFVTVACRHAPFERTTQLLDTLVPNVYVPEPSVMEEIIKTLEVAGSGERLAQSWSQLVVFGLAQRTRLVERLLTAMSSCYQYQEEEVQSKIRQVAAEILKYGKLNEDQEETKDIRSPVHKLSATALCNIVELCSNTTDKADPLWESVFEALNRLNRNEAIGVPAKPEVLAEVAKKATDVGKLGIASMAVSYLAESGFEEAISASEQVLVLMLNRTPEEVAKLLQQPASSITNTLHPSAARVVEAYHIAKSGTSLNDYESRTDTSSSESDDETSDDD